VPDVLGRNGTFLGFRKVHTRVGRFDAFCVTTRRKP